MGLIKSKIEEKNLFPNAFIYEKEYTYWPWGEVIRLATDWIITNAKIGSHILDYMCGTGYLLNNIAGRRKDVKVAGCSLTKNFIAYGLEKYPNVNLQLCNVFDYQPIQQPDIIICTAGIHHLPYSQQDLLIKKIADELNPGHFFLAGEEILRDYEGQMGRKHSVHELWSNLIMHLINNNSPKEIVQAALQVELNDLFETNEYKLSKTELLNLLEPHFSIEEIHHVWPKTDQSYGDVLLVCKKK